MPTYEYECLKCRRVFEIRQRISEPALTVCDVCGGSVRRLISSAPFILKGEGWYVTDYPSASRKKAMEPERSGDKTTPASREKSGGDKTPASPDRASKSSPGTSAASPPTPP